MDTPTNRLNYAPVPRPMSRKRLAMIATGTGATIVIGGVSYLMAQTTRPIIGGEMTCPVVSIDPAPATQPVRPVMPGGIAAPPPATQPAEK